MFALTTLELSAHKKLEEKEKEIFSHPAWHGSLSGIECEDVLRGKIPGTYLLRAGEKNFQYYLSFVVENCFSFKHQPFLITGGDSNLGWGYRNGVTRWCHDLENLISSAMHCEIESCFPLLRSS